MVPVLKPPNCPQAANEMEQSVSDVHWTLYGDPVDGAVVRYEQIRGEFNIVGHAVMAVTYNTPYEGPKFSLKRVSYQAIVAWRHGVAELVPGIESTSISPKLPIVKVGPYPTFPLVNTPVDQAFLRCASSHAMVMSPNCPHLDATTSATNGHWRIEGDPIVSARSENEPSWGLVDVIGSYAMTYSHDNHAEPSRGGSYDAVLCTVGSDVRVLGLSAVGT
jgi:hypothetical protein